MTIDNELIDNLLKDYKKPEDLIGQDGLLKQLTKALLERAMQAEMNEHLGYEKHSPAGHNTGNSRNGKSSKTLRGEFGRMPIDVPRDRNSSFDPKIIVGLNRRVYDIAQTVHQGQDRISETDSSRYHSKRRPLRRR